MTVNWGIIGCGDVTEVKSGPGFAKADGSALVSVMRRDGAKARDYAARHGVPSWTDDAQTLIDDPNVTAVYIATPPSTHKDFTLMALAAGKPVMVEKPMALDPGECEVMIEAAAKAGVSLSVAYYRRCLPRFEAMRRLITIGAIGTPRAVSVRHLMTLAESDTGWRVDPAINGGGLFVDMQSHTLDWLDYVFGPAELLSGQASNQAGAYGAEDTVVAHARYANGIVASFFCCYVANRFEDKVTVHGTKGEVSTQFIDPDDLTVVRDDKTDIIEFPNPPHAHQHFIQAVVRHINGEDPNPCDGGAGFRVAEKIQRILNASP